MPIYIWFLIEINIIIWFQATFISADKNIHSQELDYAFFFLLGSTQIYLAASEADRDPGPCGMRYPTSIPQVTRTHTKTSQQTSDQNAALRAFKYKGVFRKLEDGQLKKTEVIIAIVSLYGIFLNTKSETCKGSQELSLLTFLITSSLQQSRARLVHKIRA